MRHGTTILFCAGRPDGRVIVRWPMEREATRRGAAGGAATVWRGGIT
ncbi:MAG TPA: hypothetical protein VF792_10920 [Ktedonobacterales bacterium]